MKMIMRDNFRARFRGEIVEISPTYDTYSVDENLLRNASNELSDLNTEFEDLSRELTSIKESLNKE